LVPGWTSLALLIAGSSSVQLLALGVIGEYVGRIYLQTKLRPLFLIAEVDQPRFATSDPHRAPDIRSSQ